MVAQAAPIEGADQPAWRVRLEPNNDRARSPVFQFHRNEPDFAVAARLPQPE
jgi:hypothetical protein